ncbi:MAG: beta-lactamase family protein [Bacteroidetes bacterium]|nr:beta-lactamase family protein [Bacteroidota bacterium]
MKSKSFIIQLFPLMFWGFSLLIMGSCQHKPEWRKLSQTIQNQLDSIVKVDSIPGLTLSIRFENGQEILLSSGYSDWESKTKMYKDQPMFSGSVGKTYVAAMILKLEEEGIIDIHRKVSDYIHDSWFDSIPNSKEITIEMLLNHTAGVPEYVYFDQIWNQVHENPEKIWSVHDRMFVLLNQKPTGKAGKQFGYADSHFIILGYVIEKVTGKTYYELLKEKIMIPFHLDHTYFANKRTFKDLPSGYTVHQEDMKFPAKITQNHTYYFNPQLEWTGGGVISTVSDLTKWACILYNGDFINPLSVKKMTTPTRFNTGLFENAKYGLGSIVGKSDGIDHWGHTGFVPGYLTFMQYIPKYKFAIAIQINTDDRNKGAVIRQFINKTKLNIIQELK